MHSHRKSEGACHAGHAVKPNVQATLDIGHVVLHNLGMRDARPLHWVQCDIRGDGSTTTPDDSAAKVSSIAINADGKSIRQQRAALLRRELPQRRMTPDWHNESVA